MLDIIIGRSNINIEVSIKEVNRFITFIWSCTNFLAPKANGLLLSYKS